jgi:hypothetical protein
VRVEDCALLVEAALAKDLRKHGGLAAPQMQDLLLGGDSNVTEARVTAALRRLTTRQCIDRVVPRLIGPDERFASAKQAQSFVELCLSHARLDVLARSLVRGPDGASLRRPPVAKQATVDLLNEVAPLGPNA